MVENVVDLRVLMEKIKWIKCQISFLNSSQPDDSEAGSCESPGVNNAPEDDATGSSSFESAKNTPVT